MKETTLAGNLIAAALAGDERTVTQMLLYCDLDEREAVADALDLIGKQLAPLRRKTT